VIRKEDDPVSATVQYWRDQATDAAAQSMQTLTAMVRGVATQNGGRTTVEAAGQELAQALAATAPANVNGTLIINPCSFVRHMGLEAPSQGALPTIEKPIYAAEQQAGRLYAVVDVPAFGFVHLSPGKPAPREKKPVLLADDGVLRNEFFEAIINPTTGSLAAIHEYKSRGNRLSQQLALRTPAARLKPGDSQRDPDEAAIYSVMAADAIETTISTTTLGEIRTRGRRLDQEGRRLAGFTQTYRLWRGSRVLRLEIELDPSEEPRADPWNSYYCCRFAWSSDFAELFRTVNETRQPVSEKRFESPHYVEIADEKSSTAILTGGLTFHRRHDERMLDTLLIARGERERKFSLGIGVDLAHPLHEAIGLWIPPFIIPHCPRPASGASGWLLHLSSRNVIATSVEPLIENTSIVGLRLRLSETAGRPANLALTAFRPFTTAMAVDFLGQELGVLKVEDGTVKLDLASHEWTEVAARWS
jgi:alpha-mannosidase